MKRKTLLNTCLSIVLCSSTTVGVRANTSGIPGLQQNSKLIPQVKGSLTDTKGEPIIGASVVVKGTSNGSVSNLDGNFVLTNVPEGATLQISYVGFTSKDIAVNKTNLGTIVLKEDNKMLEELVVIGYGTQRKADLTGSVANVSAKSLNTERNANISQALQGRLAGVDIV